MGMHHSAYHFYGMHVPRDQWQEDHAYGEGERLGGIVRELGLGDKAVGVGWLAAGDYDRDMLFMCIDIKNLSIAVKLGEFRLSPTMPVLESWTGMLKTLAVHAGYTGLAAPAWITVPDCS